MTLGWVIWWIQVVYKPSCNVHSLPTCPLDFHHFPSVILVPLSPLHKGTIVSALSPLLFEVLHVTCLCIVLGNYQQCSLTLSLPLSRYHIAIVIHYIRTSFLSFTLDQVHSPANFHFIHRWHCAHTVLVLYTTFVHLRSRAEWPLWWKTQRRDSYPLLSEHSCELFRVRGSQQVEETVADSLVFLHFTFIIFVTLWSDFCSGWLRLRMPGQRQRKLVNVVDTFQAQCGDKSRATP